MKRIAPARRPVVRHALLVGYLVAGLAGGLTATLRADEVPVFRTPPPAGELADILFPEPTRSFATRSIVIEEEDAPLTTNPSTGPAADPVSASAADSVNDAVRADAPGGFALLVNFAFGEATVLPESIAALDTVGEMLNLPQARGQAIVIEGHTDAVGSADYNQTLSERRALAVRRYLISVHGIEQGRLHPVGRGESTLHDAADPRAAINRRVEFRRLDRQGG